MYVTIMHNYTIEVPRKYHLLSDFTIVSWTNFQTRHIKSLEAMLCEVEMILQFVLCFQLQHLFSLGLFMKHVNQSMIKSEQWTGFMAHLESGLSLPWHLLTKHQSVDNFEYQVVSWLGPEIVATEHINTLNRSAAKFQCDSENRNETSAEKELNNIQIKQKDINFIQPLKLATKS